MKIIYVGEYCTSEYLDNSVFLAGPTPRAYLKNEDGSAVKSWRPDFIKELERQGFKGSVLAPETADGGWLGDHEKQTDWEYYALNNATKIAFWIPRNLDTLPGFTTNVEWGYWLNTDKMIYGRPDGAPKTKYLDYMYKKIKNKVPHKSIESIVKEILSD